MMIHDHVASTVALARNVLQSIDLSRLETPVQTHSLKLILETFIEVATPPLHRKLEDAAAKTVMGRITEIDLAEKARG